MDTLRQTGYWDALIRLAGRLPLAGRARPYAPLWGGIEDLTSLFLQLADGLERLGHAAEARAAIADLVPRDSSSIDRSEESTSELQSLMRTLYSVFCLTTKNKQ